MAAEIKIRSAEMRDMKDVFALSNEKTVRENSIHPEKITWDGHVKWFSEMVANPNCRFYIVETVNGDFAGQVRFQKNDACWIVSISVVAGFRGKGIAKGALKMAMTLSRLPRITAIIKEDNFSSLCLFRSCGFVCKKSLRICGTDFKELEFAEKVSGAAAKERVAETGKLKVCFADSEKIVKVKGGSLRDGR